LLYAEEDAKAYAVLDGASVRELLPKLDEYQPETICLFRGELEPDMAEVAPYLIELHPESDFTRWAIEQGWGEHWGIFVVARSDIPTCNSEDLSTMFGPVDHYILEDKDPSIALRFRCDGGRLVHEKLKLA
jgi:hypothetical protein